MKNYEPGGLFCNGNRIPLKGVQIDVNASGVAAKVCVAQRYHNTESVPVEAVYSFPLDESCAVCGFEVEIGGRRIIGKIEEREQAFEKYDDAMAQGHGAFLVDQDRPNIFTASVGNLLPNQEATVRLTYATELEHSGDAIRLLIPTTISPRYIPADVAKKMDPAELDHITPPTVAGPVPYGLKLIIDFEAAGDVREVSCPSHPARVGISGRKIHVELMGENIQLDQDFVLNINLVNPHGASALVARDSDGVRAVMLNLFPDLSGFQRGPAEFVFLLDRSGSMQGSSIEQARTALLVALRSLESGDRFNVIGFGTGIDMLYPESVTYSQQTLDDASKKIAAMQADLGGTELLQPLKIALERMSGAAESCHILLLTDGEVGNEAELLELARTQAKCCRIFTFGVGNGVSEHLLRGLARASGGQAEFIHPNERIEPKVLKQIGRIASASISNVRIDWGNLKVDLVAPRDLPQLFNGDRFTLYGRVVGGSNGEVAVLADSPKGALRFPVTVDLEKSSSDSAIPVLMARKAIQELEEGRGAERGSSQQNRKQSAGRARILELALRYQLMSSATSFVAVEERANAAQTAQAELRRIPIALTKGWGEEHAAVKLSKSLGAAAGRAGGSILPALGGVLPPMKVRGAVARKRMAPKARESTDDVPMDLDEANGPAQVTATAPRFASAPPPPAAPKPSGLFGSIAGLFREDRAKSMPQDGVAKVEADSLYDLTLTQQADGSFEPRALKTLKVEPGLVGVLARAIQRDDQLAVRILATLAVLHAFETKYADRKGEWATLAAKAQRWLTAQKVPVPAGFTDLAAWYAAQ